MANTTKLTGGCACGAVRYEVHGDPVMAGTCYCLECQKSSGAGHVFHAMFPEAQLSSSGETRQRQYRADSGNTVSSSFCPSCGAHVFGRSSGFPGVTTVRVATLDGASPLKPQMAVYTKRLQPWDSVPAGLPAFPEMPPMPNKDA